MMNKPYFTNSRTMVQLIKLDGGGSIQWYDEANREGIEYVVRTEENKLTWLGRITVIPVAELFWPNWVFV